MRHNATTGELFKASLTGPSSDYLAGALRRARELGITRVVNPCAGSFGIAMLAVAAGFQPEQIRTGDIALASAIIGHAVQGRPLADLGIRFLDAQLQPAAELMGTPIESGAALAAIKFCEYRATHPFLLREAIAHSWEYSARGLQDQVASRTDVLRGCQFDTDDMWKQIADAADDPAAVICLSPPAQRRGDDPLTDRIAWDAPAVAHFEPRDQDRLTATLLGAKALALWPHFGKPPAALRDHVVFAQWAKRKTFQFWLCNQPDRLTKAGHIRKETPLDKGLYPLWPADRAITADTPVAIVRTSKHVALYYRDLFAHKLGSTRAQEYYLILLDGHLMSAFGMFFSGVRRSETEFGFEQFGFTVPSAVHGRISRLFMMLLTCADAGRFFRTEIPALCKLRGVQTSCISPHPEVKTDRGILTLLSRERMPDGRYLLKYATDFKPLSFSDCVREWLAKHGHIPPKGSS